MRVISGKNRGTKLVAPKGLNTRPTDDRLKENIFNLIGPIDKDAFILDLFAGSGQIGIEFLSRGAAHATFIEKNFNAVKVIKDNLLKTKNNEQSEVFQEDAMAYLRRSHDKKFKYVYIDPPYDDKKILTEVFNFIKESDIIDIGTWIIIETVADMFFDDIDIYKERIYGARKVIIAEVNNESDISR